MSRSRTLSVGRVAEALGAEAAGDLTLVVTGAAEPSEAGPEELALALAPRWGEALAKGQARAALVWPDADWRALGLSAAIFAPRGRLAMSRLTQLLDEPPLLPGIHPSAVIDPTARLGDGVGVGPLAVIGADAVVGAGTLIGAQATVAAGASLGERCIVHAGARVGRRVRIGDRCILQPNCVIGGDGFSFVTEAPSNAEQARETLGASEVAAPPDPTWHRIHSLGGVEIGDDVEVGACSTIDAGTIRATRIGQGTKIDNGVIVGHNCIVGRHALLCGRVGIAGSTVVGDRVVLAGGVGLADNITIGDDAVITAGSGVLSNVPRGRVMMGYPATRMDAQIESYKALRRLPRILKGLMAQGGGVQKARADD